MSDDRTAFAAWPDFRDQLDRARRAHRRGITTWFEFEHSLQRALDDAISENGYRGLYGPEAPISETLHVLRAELPAHLGQEPGDLAMVVAVLGGLEAMLLARHRRFGAFADAFGTLRLGGAPEPEAQVLVLLEVALSCAEDRLIEDTANVAVSLGLADVFVSAVPIDDHLHFAIGARHGWTALRDGLESLGSTCPSARHHLQALHEAHPGDFPRS